MKISGYNFCLHSGKALGFGMALLSALCSCLLADSPDKFNPLGLRTYSQEFSIKYASPQDAAKAKLKATPVYGGREWAFSARWDDNRPNDFPIHDAMIKNGLKGTFYLNRSIRNYFGEKEARKLLEGGCSIGGHTQTHPLLTSLMANEMLYEVLYNRIQREAETDQPINSFAFPSGRHRTKGVPSVQADVTMVFKRSGYINTPYMNFARENPNAEPNEISTGHQVKPGDHKVEPAKFDRAIKRILAHADKMKKKSHCIHLGVHAAQKGDNLAKLSEIFRKYRHRPDWWYCTMTQYGAYDRQYRYNKIELIKRDDATCTYRLTRPVTAELGDDVPLTFEVIGGKAVSAKADGFECKLITDAGREFVNVGHTVKQRTPELIDVVENDGNAVGSSAKSKLADFPDIKVWLYCDVAANQLHLTIENNGSEPLTDMWVTFRLPLLYIDGAQNVLVKSISPKQKREVVLPLGDERGGIDYRSGRAFFVAELNFCMGDKPNRIFATTRLNPQPLKQGCLRDAAWMMGPMSQGDIHLDTLKNSAVAGKRPKDIGDTPDKKWFSSTADDRLRYSTDRLVLYRKKDRAWKKLASKFDHKLQCYLVAIDFTLSQPTSIKLLSEGKIEGMLLNGKPVDSENINAAAGPNRLLIALSFKDGRAVYSAFPAYLKLIPDVGTVTYKNLPAMPE